MNLYTSPMTHAHFSMLNNSEAKESGEENRTEEEEEEEELILGSPRLRFHCWHYVFHKRVMEMW